MEERIKALETELENLKAKWRESQKVEFTPGEKVMYNGHEVVFLMPAKFNPSNGGKYLDPANVGGLIFHPSSDVDAHGVKGISWCFMTSLKKI